VLAGGRRLEENGLGSGFFYAPTLLGDVTQDMAVMRQEIFGPVAGMLTFADEDEAVVLANDSNLGLAAGVWTTSLGRAHRLAHALEAGTVWINTYRLASPASQLRGFKDSGVGWENGQEALSQFTRRKLVWMDYSGAVKDPSALR
jgi:aldehyde dehydrogenase (NAD+)